MKQADPLDEDMGLSLKAGDSHYRAFVGPPRDYDLIAAMTFNLLTVLGLRQHHSLLDVGCGSLRVGRLFIPYLNRGNYTGVEPNKWLVDEGVQWEIGQDLIDIKSPKFLYADTLADLDSAVRFDFAVAQSIFSHAGLDLIERWLHDVSDHLKPRGVLLATFRAGEEDYGGSGWVYPGCVDFTPETMAQVARQAGLGFKMLDWKHPRQTWTLFAGSAYDASWLDDAVLSWNTSVAAGFWKRVKS